MYDSPLGHAAPSGLRLSPETGDAMAQIIVVAMLLVVIIAGFAISTLWGVAIAFAATVIICLARPQIVPAFIVASFLFQNTIVAFFAPVMASGDAFDTMRGANFVILMSACGMFVLATLLDARGLPEKSRRWILAVLVVVGVVGVYFGLGVLRGDPRDALVYFRNTLTPLGCLGIGLVLASLYRVPMRLPILWLGIAALVFGYLELLFTFDFLSIFNGDLYIEHNIRGSIESGYWERVLSQTGFVLRGLEDVMIVPFLNLPIFSDIQVFRVGGPNFHPISFAYAIAIIAVWQFFSGRVLFLLAAFPLLLVIGSKGALVLVGFAIVMRLGVVLFGFRLALIGFYALLGTYIAGAIVYGRATGDYHVLGFLAGIRDFARNPIGQGLGLGGNLSSSIEGTLDWGRAQDMGVADIPVESAIGVMLYQMGVGAFAVLGLLLALCIECARRFAQTGRTEFLFGLTSIAVITANAVLQEEAIYSPLAIGFCLLLVSVPLAASWREDALHEPWKDRSDE